MIRSSTTGFLLTFLLSLSALSLLYRPLLVSPNTYYFSAGGDGLQAYYTSLYHIKYDTSYHRFEGMNYPYGDHVLYTANPLLTNVVKAFSEYVYDISNYTVGILNLSMLLSLMVCALVYYLLLSSLRVEPLYAALAATGIAFLSPQVDRMHGHLALVYEFFLPMLFWLMLRFDRKPTHGKSLVIGLFLLVCALTHLYFYGLMALVLTGYWAWQWLFEQRFRRPLWAVGHYALQVVIAYAVFTGWLLLTDPVTDRSRYPWGFFAYHASWEGVFLPINQPLGRLIHEHLIPIREVSHEGIAYIGLTAVGFLVVLLGSGLFFLIRHQKFSWLRWTGDPLLNALFWTSVVCLLLSFGWPFTWAPSDRLVYYVPFFRQLRSIGRFNWVFFYVINWLAFVWIYRTAGRLPLRSVRGVWLVLPLLLLYYEAFENNRGVGASLQNKLPDYADYALALPQNDWIRQVNPAQVQAIVPHPYFHLGSESVWLEAFPVYAYLLSLHTGLPLTAVHMPRTSLGQTYRNLPLALEPYRPYPLLDELPDARPLLLMIDTVEMNTVGRTMLHHARPVSQLNRLVVAELPLRQLAALPREQAQRTWAAWDTLRRPPQENLWATPAGAAFVYQSFDEEDSAAAYQGAGGKRIPLNGGVLYEGSVPSQASRCLLTFWMADIAQDLYARTLVDVQFLDTTHTPVSSQRFSAFRELATLDGPWALFEAPVEVPPSATSVRITCSNVAPGAPLLDIDELMIRPVGVDLYQKTDRTIAKNDRFYPFYLTQ
ncbi:hypothetical protein SAMN05421823_101176 [Catalinimonas alkaloidigena]|uniref:DUF6311 domain-containing protein n=1 Tax=Catalinimonas alkaloidigena TaxID=1075417 RepID=A0A1G8WT52_9BACT|nr:hypothetical protein [Catalinimonas alkaloidigena]SDJ81401.1 hypothetical protein SAMN05421823_101176 [Catalinimonas alkaloidigena]